MAHQSVFRRYELKYMLTAEQKETVLAAMKPHMSPDAYGRTTIQNLYCDTDTYRLVRRSIEKPVYKEKLRIRSYGTAAADGTVFVELKKKYKSVVYKRRIAMPEREAMAWIRGERPASEHSQIGREIEYFLGYYGTLRPVVFLSYEREAYYSLDESDFRVTFDDTVLVRRDHLTLTAPPYGTDILPEGRVLMEIKCAGGIPLWMTEVLSREHIYKTSFSKYGTAYRELIYPTLFNSNYIKENCIHVV